MPGRSSLRDIFVRLAAVAAPFTFVSQVGCDLYDVYDKEVAIRDYIDDEQVETLCGDADPSQCAAICDHLLTRIHAFNALPPCGGGECNASHCVPHTRETVTMTCECAYVAGRRPDGLEGSEGGEAAGRLDPSPMRAWVAEMEAAAIHAFVQWASELKRLEAPGPLIARARAAAMDEVVHAGMVGKLAVAYGARVQAPVVAAYGERSLAALAADNAAEGCVRESFAALVATVQARQAASPAVRAVFERIALDETRHGELAHDIQAWLWPQLSAADQAEARAAGDAALRTLAVDVLPESVRAPLGLPTVAQAEGLRRGFAECFA